MGEQTKVGLAIGETISEDTMKFIAKWDSELHNALVQARKKRARRR